MKAKKVQLPLIIIVSYLIKKERELSFCIYQQLKSGLVCQNWVGNCSACPPPTRFLRPCVCFGDHEKKDEILLTCTFVQHLVVMERVL